MNKTFVAAGLASFLLLGAGWLAWDSSRLPDAPAVALVNIHTGPKPASLQALRGQVVLVNFWATSCTTCIAEMPQLADLQQRFGAQGYQTVAIAMAYDPPAFVHNYVTRAQLPFIVSLDTTGAADRAFGGIKGTPTSFLIDRQGKVVQKIVGKPDFKQLEAEITRRLAG